MSDETSPEILEDDDLDDEGELDVEWYPDPKGLSEEETEEVQS